MTAEQMSQASRLLTRISLLDDSEADRSKLLGYAEQLRQILQFGQSGIEG